MANLSELIPQVRERVYNCPDPVIEEALRWASRDFCRETHTWTETGSFSLLAGENTLTYTPPADAVVLSWRMLIDDDAGTQIVFLPSQQWREVRSDSSPAYVHTNNLTDLTFDAAPNGDMLLRYEVALILTGSATTIPDHIADLYGDVLACGARFKLLSQAGRPWNDPSTAVLEQNTYQSGVLKAKHRTLLSNASTPKRTFLNRFL